MVQHVEKVNCFSKCVDSCGAKGHYFIIVREMLFEGFLEVLFVFKDKRFLKEELNQLSVGIYKVL